MDVPLARVVGPDPTDDHRDQPGRTLRQGGTDLPHGPVRVCGWHLAIPPWCRLVLHRRPPADRRRRGRAHRAFGELRAVDHRDSRLSGLGSHAGGTA